MKKILLAATAAICAGGVASAQVSISGEGKLGVSYEKDPEPPNTEFGVISSAKVTFTLSGTTDGGLFTEYGASFSLDADESVSDDVLGNPFVVYVGSPDEPIGKIEAGSDLGAADKKSGGLGDPGLDGLGLDDIAEAYYGGSEKKLRYEKALIPGSAIAISVDLEEAWAVGGEYDMGFLADSIGLSQFTIGAGYDTREVVRATATEGKNTVNTLSFGVIAETNQLSGKFLYSSRSTSVPAGQAAVADRTAYGVEVGYTLGATTFTANYGNNDGGTDTFPDPTTGWGVGVSHDLGGGLELKGGYASVGGGSAGNLGFLMKF